MSRDWSQYNEELVKRGEILIEPLPIMSMVRGGILRVSFQPLSDGLVNMLFGIINTLMMAGIV